MTLYSAAVEQIAKPVKKLKVKLPSPPASEVEAEQPPPKKVKRELTEKQKEALKKGQETRRLKKEMEEKIKQEDAMRAAMADKEAQEKAAAAALKKAAANERRRLQRQKKKEEAALDMQVDEAVEEVVKETKKRAPQKPAEGSTVVKKPKVPKPVQEPPKQFTELVQEMRQAQVAQSGEKVAKKVIKEEALEKAHDVWQSGKIRKQYTQVNGELDAVKQRLYNMIFG